MAYKVGDRVITKLFDGNGQGELEVGVIKEILTSGDFAYVVSTAELYGVLTFKSEVLDKASPLVLALFGEAYAE